MRTYLVITQREIAASRAFGPRGPDLVEARIREAGPYAHDFDARLQRSAASNDWRLGFQAPEDPSWCL
jgi:hypothetical protein